MLASSPLRLKRGGNEIVVVVMPALATTWGACGATDSWCDACSTSLFSSVSTRFFVITFGGPWNAPTGIAESVVPGKKCFDISDITTPPAVLLKRAIRLIFFCGPPIAAQGSQKL